MDGYADFRSHVLKREEKGLFGIPFKRLLLAGCGGGMTVVISRIPFPDLSLLFGLVAALGLIVLTAPRGGIPRWQHLWLDGRWRLVTASANAPHSLIAHLARLLQLPTESRLVEAKALFLAPDGVSPRTDLADWTTYLTSKLADDDALTLLRAPGLPKEA